MKNIFLKEILSFFKKLILFCSALGIAGGPVGLVDEAAAAALPLPGFPATVVQLVSFFDMLINKYENI